MAIVSNPPVQAGTKVLVGMNGFDATGYLVQDGLASKRMFGERDEVTDTNGNTRTKIRMNPQHQYGSVQLVIDIAATPGDEVAEVTEGDVISITPTSLTGAADGVAAYYEWQEDVQTAYARGKAIITGSLKLEASMDYTPAA